MIPSKPFASIDDLIKALGEIPGPDQEARDKTRDREPFLTKPHGSLGKLEDICQFLSAWQGRQPPRAEALSALVFAGNHGVCEQGVSAFPSAVTAQMVANFQAGGAAINQLAATFGINLDVVPIDLDKPTMDFTKAPAMSEEEFLSAFHTGMISLRIGSDLICLGEMGIGNTTPASALCLALFGGRAIDWTGPGTGIKGDALTHKAGVVGQGVSLHEKAMPDGMRALQHLGGRELAALAGAIFGARLNRMPVMIDGFVVTAAAACLQSVNSSALDHCMVAHKSAEPGHQKLLAKIKKTALLDLNMRLGEASGAALATALIKAAVNCHNGMATFEEAGVSET